MELESSKTRNPFEYGVENGHIEGKTGGKGGAGYRLVSRLGMVALKGGEMTAYIDGLPRKAGDVVDGSRITAITLEYVELSSPYKKWRMYVEPRKRKEQQER